MGEPKRVQLRRSKGWRKPEGAVVVSRPSVWGNPFPVDGSWVMWTAVSLGYRADKAGRRAAAVALHRAWLTGEPIRLGPLAANDDRSVGSVVYSDGTEATFSQAARGFATWAAAMDNSPPIELPPRPDLTPLRGHDLACWCPPGQPCHADTLLELANGGES